jgi:phosphoribosylamine---glycine ligase
MRILVVGSGGREHALAWKIAQSPLVSKLACAPGNPGMAGVAELVPIRADDVEGLAREARARRADLVVVGPEAPLVLGLADRLARDGIPVFGPSAAAAAVEGSKAFAKDVMIAAGIPTAEHAVFTELEPAVAYARARAGRVVVKADGLAAGKGVVVAGSIGEAERALHAMLVEGVHGEAGRIVLVEERLEGRDASVIALCDGERARLLPAAQDHKRAFDGDQGPNTGGMGAYSPAPVMTPEMTTRALDEIVLPTIRAMREMGCPYKGVLYAGLMITSEGPKLIEYNVRFGDPECQVLMLRLMSDLVPALGAAHDGMLKTFDLRWFPDAALTVVMAARGYPGAYEKGSIIRGLNEAEKIEEVEIFHAGTKDEHGNIIAVGGRVLNVSALGQNVSEARERAYAAVDRIRWPEGFCRRDIGYQVVAREAKGS